MKIQALINRLREWETFSDRHEVKGMQERVEREEFMREYAENAYTKWLYDNYPDAKMYGFKSPITEHEKFMWKEGYMANRRGLIR